MFPNLIRHVATTDATVTGNQMTTAICEDLTRQNLAPGRSYLDSGYLSAAVVVPALTTRAAPGSLEGCDLWESSDSWHHGSSIPRGFSGRARVAMFRPDAAEIGALQLRRFFWAGSLAWPSRAGPDTRCRRCARHRRRRTRPAPPRRLPDRCGTVRSCRPDWRQIGGDVRLANTAAGSLTVTDSRGGSARDRRVRTRRSLAGPCSRAAQNVPLWRLSLPHGIVRRGGRRVSLSSAPRDSVPIPTSGGSGHVASPSASSFKSAVTASSRLRISTSRRCLLLIPCQVSPGLRQDGRKSMVPGVVPVFLPSGHGIQARNACSTG